jgi:osmotically-inducible protein OsmY
MNQKINALVLLTAIIHAGCAPILIGTGVETVLVTRDPRTSGTQFEDQAIAQKFSSQLKQKITNTESIHVNATSYNRRMLLTGEVPNQNTSALMTEIARRIENVEHVFNELSIQAPSSISQRSSDALVTMKVKSSLLINAPSMADSMKVVTESGVVYLLGIAPEKTTQQAIDIIRGIGGVKRVVLLVERK